MSNYTQKEGQGSLFKNTKKTLPNQPDGYGSIMINGKEMRVAAWIKQGKNDSYYSLQLSESDKPKTDKTESVRTNKVQNHSDDLPF
jgi:hypothetical protein